MTELFSTEAKYPTEVWRIFTIILLNLRWRVCSHSFVSICNWIDNNKTWTKGEECHLMLTDKWITKYLIDHPSTFIIPWGINNVDRYFILIHLSVSIRSWGKLHTIFFFKTNKQESWKNRWKVQFLRNLDWHQRYLYSCLCHNNETTSKCK